MTDYKEFAKQMRENAVKNEQGNIVCSPELWEEIASVVERAIIPPCKVGDYVLWDNGLKDSKPKMLEVKGFYYNSANLGLRYILEGCQPIINFSAIVGIVSKEEAEEKLKELGK